MKYAFGIFAVLLVIALGWVYFEKKKEEAGFLEEEKVLLEKEEEEFDFQKFVGKPAGGGIACVSLADAKDVAAAALEASAMPDGPAKDAVRARIGVKFFPEQKCSMEAHYVPKRIALRFESDLLLLEVGSGEEFRETAWVVVTPATLKPLIKEEEAHKVEPPGAMPPDPARPPGKIPQGAWQ
ncbi:MAG: hypothetical protein HYS44_03400 [Candidatus Niyogibacteria bacterium]|nr:hypothetical protein [Candidatus Niyogibacteria bacterium]